MLVKEFHQHDGEDTVGTLVVSTLSSPAIVSAAKTEQLKASSRSVKIISVCTGKNDQSGAHGDRPC